MISLVKTICKILLLSIASKRTLFYKCGCLIKKYQFFKPLIWLVPCTTLALRPVLTEITQQDVEENITQLVTLARIALENGDLEKAQSILEMGISVGEEYRAYIIMPYMYDLLSSILFSTGNLKKAEEVLVRAIEQMVQLGSPENDTQIIDFKLRLARIYSFNDKHKLAEMGFRNCVALQEAKILNGDTSTRTGTLYVNVLFWYAMHKIKTKEYKGAKRLIDNAYTYSLKIRGLTPYQEMVILYTMGDLNIQLEEYDMALQNIRSAVLMGKGIGSLNLPRYYMKLGMIYLKFDLKRTAEKWLTEAYNLAEIFDDKDVIEEVQKLLLELD